MPRRPRWKIPSTPDLAPADLLVTPQPPRTASDLLKTSPVWLVSAVLHALLLVTLALLTHSPPPSAVAVIVAAYRTDHEVLRELTSDLRISDPEIAVDEPPSSLGDWDPAPLTVALPVELGSAQWSMEEHQASVSGQLRAGLELAPNDRRLDSAGGAQFFGIQTPGERFVFIVDSSTSMHAKFADAKRELEQAVRRLDPNQLFYVIFFDRQAKRLRLGTWNVKRTNYRLNSRPEPNLVPATDENTDALIYWMNTIQLDSDTQPYSAVAFALEKLRPDAIFLLSDGEFRDGGADGSISAARKHGKAPQGGTPTQGDCPLRGILQSPG